MSVVNNMRLKAAALVCLFWVDHLFSVPVVRNSIAPPGAAAIVNVNCADRAKNDAVSAAFTEYAAGQHLDAGADETARLFLDDLASHPNRNNAILLLNVYGYGANFGLQLQGSVSALWETTNRRCVAAITDSIPQMPVEFLSYYNCGCPAGLNSGWLLRAVHTYMTTDVATTTQMATAITAVTPSAPTGAISWLRLLSGIDTLQQYYRVASPSYRAGYILTDWDDASLEARHDFIQLIFPMDVPSAASPSAPYIDRNWRPIMVSIGRTQPILRTRIQTVLLLHAARMLRFWGLGFNENGVVVVISDAFRNKILARGNHNLLRVTRMLHSLTMLGYDNVATRLRDFFQGQNGIDRRSLGYFLNTDLVSQIW
jgi:hypothetical protein